MNGFYIAFGIAFVTILLILVFRKGGKISRAKVEWYKHLAQRLNLQHSSERFMLGHLNTITGNLDGNALKIYEKVTGNDNNSQYLHTFITFEPNPFEFEFEIGRKQTGAENNVTIDDPSIHTQFYFSSPQPEKLKPLITSDVLMVLNKVGDNLGTGIKSTTENFTHFQLGGPKREEQMQDLEDLLQLMRALVGNKNQ